MVDQLWFIISKLPPEGYALLGKLMQAFYDAAKGGETDDLMEELERAVKAMAAKRAIRG